MALKHHIDQIWHVRNAFFQATAGLGGAGGKNAAALNDGRFDSKSRSPAFSKAPDDTDQHSAH